MKFGEVFAGIGGMGLGLERTGMECRWQIEIDSYCRQVLAKHWPSVARHEDVRDCGSHNLERVDLICGGFPCQDVSVAGKRAGLSGRRSGLFYEFARIASELCPAWLVLENVPGLLSSEDGRDMGAVIGGLEDAGYSVAWRVLDSQWFGVAQRRRRVFFVCHSDARRAGAVLFEPEGGARHPAAVRKAGTDIAHSLDARSGGVSGKENQETLVSCPLTGNPYGDHESREGLLVFDGQSGGKCWTHAAEKPQALSATHIQAVAIHENQRGELSLSDTAGSLNAGGGGKPGQGCSTVAYTLRENERNTSQGPANLVAHALTAHGGSHGRIDGESETFVGQAAYAHRSREVAGLPRGLDGRRYKALGNAVTVPVLEWIGRRIMMVQGQ